MPSLLDGDQLAAGNAISTAAVQAGSLAGPVVGGALVSGVLVRHIGTALFFPVAGGIVAVAILGGLTQREFRTFGAAGSDSDAGAPGSLAEAAIVGETTDRSA